MEVDKVLSLASYDASSLNENDTIFAKGYSVPGDGGGGTFILRILPESEVDGYMNIGADTPPSTPTPPAAHAWMWQRLYDSYVNVRWFGARDNGSLDCFTAIDKAIEYLEGRTGGTLYFPFFDEGVYLIDDEKVTITGNNIKLLGDGTVTLYFKGLSISNRDAILVQGTATLIEKIGGSGLSKGDSTLSITNAGGYTIEAGDYIEIDGGSDLPHGFKSYQKVDQVRVNKITENLSTGKYDLEITPVGYDYLSTAQIRGINYVTGFRIEGLNITTDKGYTVPPNSEPPHDVYMRRGVMLEYCYDAFVTQTHCLNTSHAGVMTNHSNKVRISNCSVKDFFHEDDVFGYNYGFFFWRSFNCIAEDCIAETGRTGFDCTSSDNVLFVGNTAVRCGISPHYSTKVNVVGNTILGGRTSMFRAEGSFKDNDVYTDGTFNNTGIQLLLGVEVGQVSIENNNFYSTSNTGSSYGVRCYDVPKIKNLSINGNCFYDLNYGIEVYQHKDYSGADLEVERLIITNNEFSGVDLYSIKLHRTSNTFIANNNMDIGRAIVLGIVNSEQNNNPEPVYDKISVINNHSPNLSKIFHADDNYIVSHAIDNYPKINKESVYKTLPDNKLYFVNPYQSASLSFVNNTLTLTGDYMIILDFVPIAGGKVLSVYDGNIRCTARAGQVVHKYFASSGVNNGIDKALNDNRLEEGQLHNVIWLRKGEVVQVLINGSVAYDSSEDTIYTPPGNAPRDVTLGMTTFLLVQSSTVYSCIAANIEVWNEVMTGQELVGYIENRMLTNMSRKGSNDLITSANGDIEVGAKYQIVKFGAGDDFTKVGASANEEGVIFLATNTPPSWGGGGSELKRLGCMLKLKASDIDTSANSWADSSGNANNATITGSYSVID